MDWVFVFGNSILSELPTLRSWLIYLILAPVTTGTTDTDFNITIQVGPNNIPCNAFDASFKDDKTLAFSTPILALFQQPLAVEVQLNSTAGATLAAQRTVVVTMIAELAIQKEYYSQRQRPNPRGVR